MQAEAFCRLKSVPVIVRIVINQAMRHLAQGSITQAVFEEQMRRIAREELEPLALTLLVRELPAGGTRFLITERDTGSICNMLDFAADGSPESDLEEALARASRKSP